MKIQLFLPPNNENLGKKWTPLGIGYIGAVLEKAGHDVKGYNFIYRLWDEADKEMLQLVIDNQPDIVGISCLTNNRTTCVKFAEKVKASYPNIKIIFGGPHASIMHEQMLTHFDQIDFIVIGEGENTIIELVDAIEKKKEDFSDIRGIAYKKGDKIIKTEERELIRDLDNLPFPKIEYFKNDINETKEASVYGSRGCVYRCNFCSTSHFWKNKWRPRTPESIGTEIEHITKNFQVEHIYFTDDSFSLDRKRAIDICKLIVEKGIKLTFSCSTRVNFVDDESLYWFKKAGFTGIFFGVESGSPRILKTIGKSASPDEIIRACKYVGKANLVVNGFALIVGTPGENQESIDETKRLIDEVHPYVYIDYVRLLEVFPGVPLYDYCKNIGFINDEYWLTDKKPPIFTAEHSEEQLQKWATEIVLHYFKRKGHLWMTKLALKSLLQHPMLTTSYLFRAKFISTYLGGFLKKNTNKGQDKHQE